MIRAVIDTNIWIASLSSKSKSHWIIEAFLQEKFEVVASTEILIEYEEKLKQKYPQSVADAFLEALAIATNVRKAEPFYHWLLLKDKDDNKFTDCAISAGVDYLVTEDRDFDLLKKIDFPKVTVLSLSEFEKVLVL